MTVSLSGFVKFVLGFALAIALLFLAGAGLTRYLLTRLATPPPRPSFTNDPSPSPVVSPAASPAASPSPSPTAASPDPVAASPTPSISPSPVQGYQARVVQPIGLKIRQEPSLEAAEVGGVAYNTEVTVLEDSPDGAWHKVRVNGVEGWIKAGNNTERIN